MKLKTLIKEIEKNQDAKVTVDKTVYLALLREVNKLRFKSSQLGSLTRNKKHSQGSMDSLRAARS